MSIEQSVDLVLAIVMLVVAFGPVAVNKLRRVLSC